jgi:hypothetical protein
MVRGGHSQVMASTSSRPACTAAAQQNELEPVQVDRHVLSLPQALHVRAGSNSVT